MGGGPDGQCWGAGGVGARKGSYGGTHGCNGVGAWKLEAGRALAQLHSFPACSNFSKSLLVLFLFSICRWLWQGGLGAVLRPSPAAWPEPLCTAAALGGRSATAGDRAGRAAGRPAASLREGRGAELFIYTKLLERTVQVSCRDRTQGLFDQTRVCRSSRGLAVSPDWLLFHAVAGGCWAAALHASVSIKYRARTGCHVSCWGCVVPAAL